MPSRAGYAGWLSRWLEGEKERAIAQGCRRIVLKHPMLCLVVRELQEVAKPDFVVVTRPFEAIEATRTRRGWLEVHGATGARSLYNAAHVALHEGGISYLGLPFAAFRHDARLQDKLLSYCGLAPPPRTLEVARRWVR